MPHSADLLRTASSEQHSRTPFETGLSVVCATKTFKGDSHQRRNSHTPKCWRSLEPWKRQTPIPRLSSPRNRQSTSLLAKLPSPLKRQPVTVVVTVVYRLQSTSSERQRVTTVRKKGTLRRCAIQRQDNSSLRQARPSPQVGTSRGIAALTTSTKRLRLQLQTLTPAVETSTISTNWTIVPHTRSLFKSS